MRDRNVQYPNRFKITRPDGSTEIVTISAEPGAITEPGTLINKATLLSDETAEIFELYDNDATVNNSLRRTSLASYMAFCANANADNLDAAFGKENDGRISGLGRQLAMYAKFKGEDSGLYPLTHLTQAERFSEIVNSNEASKEASLSHAIFNIISASPYAVGELKGKDRALPDIVLYDNGAADHLDLTSAVITKTGVRSEYCKAEFEVDHIYLYAEHSNASGTSGVKVTIPLKNITASYPFMFYKYLNIKMHDTLYSGIGQGYSNDTGAKIGFPGGISIALGDNRAYTGLAEKSDESYAKLRLVDVIDSSDKLILDLQQGAFDDGGNRTGTLRFAKIWLSEN